jgi:hypothetical protein
MLNLTLVVWQRVAVVGLGVRSLDQIAMGKLGMEWERARPRLMMKEGKGQSKLDATIALSAKPHADPQ